MRLILSKRLLQHIAFWSFYVVIYTINYTFAPSAKSRPIGETFVFLPGHLFFTYCQMYWLVPRLLFTRKYFLYFLISLLILATALYYGRWAGKYFLDWHQPPENSWFKYYVIGYGRAAFSYLPVAALAVSIKLYKGVLKERERAFNAETEKVKMELDMLRSQLHPHFLFNTLNNLYSLTLSSSATASTVVLHLSELLRYILYECEGPRVSLEKEVSMLKKYAELEKLRYGDRLDVAFSISGSATQLAIAPLLLLPFIENSFKHSTRDHIGQSWINIHIHLEDNQLSFHVVNSRSGKLEMSPGAGGIGLQNVKKRLALLYPGKHELEIIEEQEAYTLKLQIKLDRIETTAERSRGTLYETEITSI